MTRQLLSCAAGALAVVGVSLAAQSVPEIRYDAVADALTLPSYGEVAGVATNSRGHVFVYARTGHAVATLGDERTFYHGGSRLFEFDQTGKFVKEIGQGVYAVNFAQQVRVDSQDNVWIVDAGSNQVVKFDADGRFLMVLGRKPENIPLRAGPGVSATVADAQFLARGGAPQAGRGGEGGGRGGGGTPGAGINGDNFNRPSDVAWDRSGNIYVADGFGTNNRIAKFTRDGDFVKTWGRTGSGPGQFNQIRGLVADASGNLYAADAGNKRIQVFDGEGTFKSEITGVGTPQALCISGGATQYLFSSNSNDSESMDNGEIYKLQLSGQVVGRFGKAGRMAKEFGMTNALDCRTDTTLWVGEVWNWRAQKVTLMK
ncbi:MAG TPA: peptidyl-alpha-hydroxyglycine alpha-amidating lyase family protein [Vicinamibacterales bacterium]|nr:peptidyl-alpha-hydroxyglycine alpha-amidating lyase family protein [Vicinamibacterales bacterium]